MVNNKKISHFFLKRLNLPAYFFKLSHRKGLGALLRAIFVSQLSSHFPYSLFLKAISQSNLTYFYTLSCPLREFFSVLYF